MTCCYFLRDACDKGDACRYVHQKPLPQGERCSWGARCRFGAFEKDAVADASARRLLVHAPGFLARGGNDSRTLFTKRFVRDALRGAAADEALVGAVARFLNEARAA